ncbi:MAG TPA: DNA recombination protein RmuC [Steroidobacteraceae bacterium]|jgi:DNA recombination protein RmuC|nr:DNA recombination protein RmuC [Steroidobacteraceae bacterium]
MTLDLALLAAILAAVAAALAAGWWMARRRAAALESERTLAIDRAMEQLDRRFDDLAGRQLRENIENFLRLARENLGGHQQNAQASLREREQAIEALVKPIQETLARTSEALREIEAERQRDFGSLRQHLTDMRDSHSALQRETRNLVQALSKPQVRGQWGEIALRRLVELAGMTAHCDFEEQVHVAGPEGALRPDMVVHLPEGRDVVVDVKTPLDAYLAAAEAPSDELRAASLKRHAQHVAERVRMLSSKNYASQFARAPQFVVLFLPGDQFLSSALDQQPDLLDRAMGSNIILTTPSTLLALLKTIYNGWQNVRLAENAERIRTLAEDLHARLVTFRSHMGKVGSSLESSITAFNAAVGSLERSVLPGARKFVELGVRADKPIEELPQVEVTARVTESAARRLTPPEEH